MPEIAEVRLTADELQSLVGVTITKIKDDFGIRGEDYNLPLRIKSIDAYGKRLIFRFSKLVMIIGLGMTGMLHFSNQKRMKQHDHIRFYYSPKEIRNEEEESESARKRKYFVYNDIRKVGSSVKFETELVISGVDVLQSKYRKSVLREILNHHSTMNIASLLLNRQDYFPGIGNYLKSEILYEAGILPTRSCGEVRCKELYGPLHDVPRRSYAEGGLTISTFYTPSGKEGGFVRKIYQKERCPRRHKVTKITQGGRSTFYCPKCQS